MDKGYLIRSKNPVCQVIPSNTEPFQWKMKSFKKAYPVVLICESCPFTLTEHVLPSAVSELEKGP